MRDGNGANRALIHNSRRYYCSCLAGCEAHLYSLTVREIRPCRFLATQSIAIASPYAALLAPSELMNYLAYLKILLRNCLCY